MWASRHGSPLSYREPIILTFEIGTAGRRSSL